MNQKIREAYDYAEEFYEKYYVNGPLNLFHPEFLETFLSNVIYTDKPFEELDDDNFRCDTIRKKIALVCLLEYGVFRSDVSPDEIGFTFEYLIPSDVCKSERFFRETEKRFKRGDPFRIYVWWETASQDEDDWVTYDRHRQAIDIYTNRRKYPRQSKKPSLLLG